MDRRVLQVFLVILLQTSKALSENGVVLTSTLTSTDRDYACVNETVVVTCSGGIGTELVWNYNGTGSNLPFLFNNNNANPPQAMLNMQAGVIAYLANRISTANETFQYTSRLSIERITLESVDVNCTVTSDPINMTDSVVRGLSIRMSAVPDEVAVRIVNQLGCVGQNENTSQYLLEWMPPDNINDFDLSHYEINITGPSINQTLRCIETSTIFLLDTTTDDAGIMISISIVAVNQCGQRGNATESSIMIQLGKCPSPIPDSSSAALKISASLCAFLLIATVLSTP